GGEVERSAVTGGQPGGVELVDQVAGVGAGSELCHQLDRRGGAAFGRAGRQGPGDGQFVGGAGVPADPDPRLGGVGFGQQRDIGDQGAQQPFAVLVAGGGRPPECGEIGCQVLQ